MSAEKAAVPVKPETPKGPIKQRSPNYPGIDLKDAVEKARKMFDKEGTNPVPPSVLQGRWGYSAKSSSGMVAIGALRKFGLIDGSPNLKLTPLAMEILNPGSQTKAQALRKAALLPELHKQLWEEYKEGLPSDENLEFVLRSRQFTDQGAKSFIGQLRATLAYAGLTAGGEKVDIPSESESGKGDTRVDLPGAPPKPLPARAGMNQDTFTLDEGQVVLQWPSRISPESYEDLKDWLDLMARKVSRAVRAADPPQDE